MTSVTLLPVHTSDRIVRPLDLFLREVPVSKKGRSRRSVSAFDDSVIADALRRNKISAEQAAYFREHRVVSGDVALFVALNLRDVVEICFS